MLPEEEAGGAKGLGMVLSLGFLKFNVAAVAREVVLFPCADCLPLACCTLAWFDWTGVLKYLPCP